MRILVMLVANRQVDFSIPPEYLQYQTGEIESMQQQRVHGPSKDFLYLSAYHSVN